jgi:hypothetical protein
MPIAASQPKAIGRLEPTGTSKHQRDWLLVELETGGSKVLVPALTRVALLGVVNGPGGTKRDRFEIEDFEYKGKIALSTHAPSGSRLIDRPTYTGPALVEWDRGQGKVKVGVPSAPNITKIEAAAISDPIVPNGTHALRPKLPMDRASESDPFPCERYQPAAAHACHWWLIEWQPERGFSFHCGSGTLGCVTVTEHAKWEKIYGILSLARTNDGKFSGQIIVRGHRDLLA